MASFCYRFAVRKCAAYPRPVVSCAPAKVGQAAGCAGRLPLLQISAPGNTRFALLPPFQPLKLAATGAGSGIDPDMKVLSDNRVPLNTAVPVYPADTALAEYRQTGAAGDLAALSVSAVYNRPWFTEDEQALRFQQALPLARQSTTRGPLSLTRLGVPRRAQLAGSASDLFPTLLSQHIDALDSAPSQVKR